MVEGLFNANASPILLLKRLPGADWSRATVEIITPAVEMEVRYRLSMESEDQQLELYTSLARNEMSRHLAGVVYEVFTQEKQRRQRTY